jgi:hypothetical protein
MSQGSITSIQDMLAPAVLMTGTSILTGAIQTLYANVGDRMRSLSADKLERLSDSHGGLLSRDELGVAGMVRVDEIDTQLPMLRDRYQALHFALQFIYGSMSFLVISMILIAIDITVHAPAVGTAALVAVLLSTVTLLVALALPLLSVRKAVKAVAYEVERTLELGVKSSPPSSSP